ncbi:hypothetical protein B0J13DRAFT_614439 [Dactylonectria estremocensis]|uniref:Uncharacterized protein n=1 Tax=Dactylonectria estremocensis TaxID=1079267 RepID=A0A9P9I7X6_9HYPO|nr:hypothetical protein B0J13DRAFT_614439 [Dactylonectria estremocensis]
MPRVRISRVLTPVISASEAISLTETIPDFNLLFQNYLREPQAYPRRQRRSTRNARRQQSELPNSNQTTVREDTAEVGQTSPTGSSPTESHQLGSAHDTIDESNPTDTRNGSAPDTIDESNPPNMRKEEALFLLDETNGDYAENGIGSLEYKSYQLQDQQQEKGQELDEFDRWRQKVYSTASEVKDEFDRFIYGKSRPLLAGVFRGAEDIDAAVRILQEDIEMNKEEESDGEPSELVA